MTREEAIQAIKERIDYYESDKRLKGAIETLIPEFAESEDERIRKLNLWFLRKYKEISHYPGNSEDGIDMVIDYLEKQKEQKPLKVGENAYFDPNTDMWFIKKEQKPIRMEVYEIGKGTTICGQDYKCKKDYKAGNCWYIKDVIYHCNRDGYLNDQNGVSWSCAPEWFNEYIYTNNELADKEKNNFVSGQFLQCKLSFDGFKEGEHYWLEYIGDDMYVGRSDNILNQKFHITPRQLFTLFSQQLDEVQGPPEEEKQASLNYEPPFDENPSDREIIDVLIKHLKEQDGFLTAINSVSTKAILSWLEKKKEQQQEWSEKDKEIIGWACCHLGEYAASFKDKNERKSNMLYELSSKLNSLRPQPKQEWSEEDEKVLNSIIAYIETGNIYATSKVNMKIWLKSLRPQSKDEIYKEKDEAFKLDKHQLAIKFMNYFDENRPDGKMGLSNGECEDIDKAFKENDWTKIIRYYEKYRPSWKPSEEDEKCLQELMKHIENCVTVYGASEPEWQQWLNLLKKLMKE